MRKIIAVLSAVLMLSSFAMTANAETTVYTLGDTDRSGEVTLNSADLAFLKKVLLDVEKDKSMSDVNEDGEVDILDMIRLKKMLAKTQAGIVIENGTNPIEFQ